MSYTPNSANEAYWRKYTEEASLFYKTKMLELGTIEELRGSFHGTDAPNHLMYKIDTLYSKDGHRAYEFLIEYDILDPTVGIYYGCKGLTLSRFDHSKEIEIFKDEWEQIRAEVCTILNNTFPGKDFVMRIKKTNNANDNTFWPFWFSLYEEEDIKEVGLRAVYIIRNVYKRLLDGEEMHEAELPKVKLKPNKTAFTHKAYSKFKSKLSVKIKYTKKIDKEATKKNIELFERFLSNAEKRRMISKDKRYECAWQVQQLSNVDFIRLMYSFFQYMVNQGLYLSTDDNGNAKIPWGDLCNIILTPEGKTYNESLRTQQTGALGKDKTKIEQKKEVVQWMKLVKDMIK